MAFKMKGGNDPIGVNFGAALNMTDRQREKLPPELVDIIDKKEKAEAEPQQKEKE